MFGSRWIWGTSLFVTGGLSHQLECGQLVGGQCSKVKFWPTNWTGRIPGKGSFTGSWAGCGGAKSRTAPRRRAQLRANHRGISRGRKRQIVSPAVTCGASHRRVDNWVRLGRTGTSDNTFGGFAKFCLLLLKNWLTHSLNNENYISKNYSWSLYIHV